MSAPRSEFIAVGSELLEPWRSDTNGAYLSRRLGERGVPVRFRSVVGDVSDDLKGVFRVALGRSELIVVTGGLGPTIDDLTREAVAEVLDLPLIMDEGIAKGIEERFRRHGLTMPPQNLRQAMVPRGAEVLPNPLGTAPGLWIRAGAATMVLLPGVPDEMRRITEESFLPRLGEAGDRFVYRVIKIIGLTESEVDRRLEDVARSAGEVVWTILASPAQIEVHLRERVRGGAPAREIERLDQAIVTRLGAHVFARDEETMPAVVGRMMVGRGDSLSTAESITGGAIARRITSVPGASRYFRGAVVAYGDDAKKTLLGVRAETLAAHGSVSPQVALEMARGARSAFGSTWALSASGYAGPEGGGPDRPAGTVILALAGPRTETVRELRWPGERHTVRTRAERTALDMLRRGMLEDSG